MTNELAILRNNAAVHTQGLSMSFSVASQRQPEYVGALLRITPPIPLKLLYTTRGTAVATREGNAPPLLNTVLPPCYKKTTGQWQRSQDAFEEKQQVVQQVETGVY